MRRECAYRQLWLLPPLRGIRRRLPQTGHRAAVAADRAARVGHPGARAAPRGPREALRGVVRPGSRRAVRVPEQSFSGVHTGTRSRDVRGRRPGGGRGLRGQGVQHGPGRSSVLRRKERRGRVLPRGDGGPGRLGPEAGVRGAEGVTLLLSWVPPSKLII